MILCEDVHSVFYAPLYAAMENGYFKDEGIYLKLNTSAGTEQVQEALSAGECDIALMGPEACITAYAEGKENYPVCFAQLTQRAGDMLVSRNIKDGFDWDDLSGKTILGRKQGSMPQITFEYVLKKQGIDPNEDLTILQDIEEKEAAQAFSSGQGEYLLLPEPEATRLEKLGKGKIAASLGMVSGRIPYSILAARKDDLDMKPEQLSGFMKALRKGMDYVLSHTPKETARVIEPLFPDTDRDSLVLILERYYEQDSWKGNLTLDEGSYCLLMELMKDSGLLEENIPYEEMINKDYSGAYTNN